MKTGIKNQQELNERLETLRALKSVHETRLLAGVTSIYDTILHPAPIIKECLSKLAADKEFRMDLLTLFTHWIARRFRKKSEASGNGESFAFKAFEFVNNPKAGIIDFITKLFKSKTSKS